MWGTCCRRQVEAASAALAAQQRAATEAESRLQDRLAEAEAAAASAAAGQRAALARCSAAEGAVGQVTASAHLSTFRCYPSAVARLKRQASLHVQLLFNPPVAGFAACWCPGSACCCSFQSFSYATPCCAHRQGLRRLPRLGRLRMRGVGSRQSAAGAGPAAKKAVVAGCLHSPGDATSTL